MSYALERKEGIEITDEDDFRSKVCRKCKHKDICYEWEGATMATLYTNRNASTKELLIGFSGKKGVFRCASFEES